MGRSSERGRGQSIPYSSWSNAHRQNASHRRITFLHVLFPRCFPCGDVDGSRSQFQPSANSCFDRSSSVRSCDPAGTVESALADKVLSRSFCDTRHCSSSSSQLSISEGRHLTHRLTLNQGRCRPARFVSRAHLLAGRPSRASPGLPPQRPARVRGRVAQRRTARHPPSLWFQCW